MPSASERWKPIRFVAGLDMKQLDTNNTNWKLGLKGVHHQQMSEGVQDKVMFNN